MDGFIGLLALVFWVWTGAMWVYGEAYLFQVASYGWAVIGLAFPPVGFVVGVFQSLFGG